MTVHTEIYHAPKPQKNRRAVFISVVVRIVLPPVLLWDAARLIINKLTGEKLAALILPALNIPKQLFELPEMKEDVRKLQVITHDGAVLDTLQISPSEPTGHVIYFCGNAYSYEDIVSEMMVDMDAVGCSVTVFNYRGVGSSQKKPAKEDDLYTDGIAQVQRLLSEGVSPNNIILHGTSLGGAVAAGVAAHFHRLNIKVHLYDAISFSSLPWFVVGHIRTVGGPHTGHHETYLGKILGWISIPFLMLFFSAQKWSMNAAADLRSIPKTYRKCVVVRSSKEQRAMHGHRLKDDKVITYYASAYFALKPERRSEKNSILRKRAIAQRKGNLLEVVRLTDELATLKAGFRGCKLYADHFRADGHNLPMCRLFSRDGKRTGQGAFHSFFHDRYREADQSVDEKTHLISDATLDEQHILIPKR